ncbi:MAG: SIR2 family protein [Mycobacteriales bacterium]
MRGHVFVARADIRRLVCDAWMLPTDARPYVTPGWFVPPEEPSSATRSWLDQFRQATAVASASPFRPNEYVRVIDAPSPSGAVPILTRTATTGQAVDWGQVQSAIAAFVRQARRLKRTGVSGRRPRPLLAVPAIGTGSGGGAAVKGEALDQLLHRLSHLADNVDIVLVVATPAMAAAARSHRRSGDHRQTFVRELGSDLVAEAERLATRVRRGEVVLFTGAGTGVPAGLPTWDGLLRQLAMSDMFTGPELRELSALDKAGIIERKLGRQGLIDAIARAVSTDQYALSHSLLANLPIKEVATLNYDELLETAALDAGRRLAVLPYERPGEAHDGWLLKLHGCVRPERRADIVLTRADYLSLGQHRAALTGLLQAMLVTRHMLFVGFGLSDEHFHAVVHDVRRAIVEPGSVDNEPFGTALVLRPQRAAELVWADDLRLLSMGSDDPARRLEIFLDLLATDSDQGWQHVLDDSFVSALEGPEVALREYLHTLISARSVLEPGGAWPAVETMLRRFGYVDA